MAKRLGCMGLSLICLRRQWLPDASVSGKNGKCRPIGNFLQSGASTYQRFGVGCGYLNQAFRQGIASKPCPSATIHERSKMQGNPAPIWIMLTYKAMVPSQEVVLSNKPGNTLQTLFNRGPKSILSQKIWSWKTLNTGLSSKKALKFPQSSH